MNTENSQSSQGGNSALGGKSKVGGIAVILLLVAYSFAAPKLNTRYGWSLPQIQTDSSGNVRLAETATAKSPAAAPTAKTTPQPKETQATATKTEAAPKSGASDNRTEASASSNGRKSGPLADRMRSSRPSDSQPAQTPATESADSDLMYGILREVSKDRYVSPQGLLYTPGSAEGHRLEHLRRHTKDMPNRPGSHGVFDGEMEGALRTVDRAYEKAKKNQRTTKRVDDGRTIYTVDMGSRVGYVGGRDGNRRRKPMARRVQLVLEGTRVITAYPK